MAVTKQDYHGGTTIDASQPRDARRDCSAAPINVQIHTAKGDVLDFVADQAQIQQQTSAIHDDSHWYGATSAGTNITAYNGPTFVTTQTYKIDFALTTSQTSQLNYQFAKMGYAAQQASQAINAYSPGGPVPHASWMDASGYYPPDPNARPLPPRSFNRYLNASDLLEEFITFIGNEGVRPDDMMQMPVELFVKWLIVRACEQDNEAPPAEVKLELPAPTPQPRCLGCQRFMKRTTQLKLHDKRCSDLYFARELVAA